jgi:hypothetical protein
MSALAEQFSKKAGSPPRSLPGTGIRYPRASSAYWTGIWCGLFFFLGTAAAVYSGLTQSECRRMGGESYGLVLAVFLGFDGVCAWLILKGQRIRSACEDVFRQGQATIGVVENAWLTKQNGMTTHMRLHVRFQDAKGGSGLIKGNWPIATVPGEPEIWGKGADVVVLYDPMDLSRAAVYPLDYEGLLTKS